LRLELLTFLEPHRQPELRIEKGQVAALAALNLEERLGQGDGSQADVRDKDNELSRPLVASPQARKHTNAVAGSVER